MDWGGPEFVLALVAISTLGWVVNNWIRARHGYEPAGEWGDTPREQGELDDKRERQLLVAENERLTGQVTRLEDRIAVLERIATDPAGRTARAIDALR